MPDPREALAAALAEQSPDDDELRDWLTDRAEFVLDALQSGGYEVVRLDAAPVGRIEAARETSERCAWCGSVLGEEPKVRQPAVGTVFHVGCTPTDWEGTGEHPMRGTGFVTEEASDGWRKARGVIPAGEPSEDVIRRMRDGTP